MGGDEQDSAAGGYLRLVHLARHLAQAREHVARLGVGEVVVVLGHARMARDLRERIGVGLRRHLRALELGARLHEAVHDAGLLDVHHIGEQLDAAVVAERLRLVGEVDGAGLVAHVSRVVAQARDRDLRDHDLLGVLAGAAEPAGEFSTEETASRW